MDIELLKTFLEVKSTRHFGKAADNLFITQAAVSTRIKQLEGHFGVPLFLRTRNNIQLTAEGERLVPHAETILASWSIAKSDVALKDELKHQVIIGSTQGLWQYVLQDKLPLIQRDIEGLAIQAETHSPDTLIRMLLENVLDCVFMYEPPNIPELSKKSIGKVNLILISSSQEKNYKTALNSNYVYVDWGTAFSVFHAKKFGDITPPVLNTNMASVAETYIRTNEASAYLPESVLDESNKKIKAISGAPRFSKEVFLIYKSNSEKLTVMESLNSILTKMH